MPAQVSSTLQAMGRGWLAGLVASAVIASACASQSPALSPESATSPAVEWVARVNDEGITREEWERALALDRAMSALAGQPAPDAEAVLQRLVNERLVLQRVSAGRALPSVEAAEARLRLLLARWNASEAQLEAVLSEHRLHRADVVAAIRRLLLVEEALRQVGDAAAVERWLAEQRRQARIGLLVSFSAPRVPTPQARAVAPPTPLVLAPPSPTPVQTPLVLAAQSTAPTPTSAPRLPKNPAPDFVLPSVDGRNVALSDFRGRAVVLNFWASWCPSCRAEAQDFGAFARAYRERNVVVVGVNLRESAEVVREFAGANGMDYPLLLDADGSVAQRYDVVGIPTTVFIDPIGDVRARHVGLLNAQQLAEYVQPLLEEFAPEARAPDFALPADDRSTVSLAALRGRPVVLVFYRSAGCGACQQYLRAVQAAHEQFARRNAQVLAIAVQGVTQASVVRALGQLSFPVLADEQHVVSEAFGVYNRFGDGLAAPAVFVIDAQGRVVWSHIGNSPEDYPPVETVLARLP